MERLREEVEKAKQLQSQKETLEQKLEVKASYIKDLCLQAVTSSLSGTHLIKKALVSFVTSHSTFV